MHSFSKKERSHPFHEIIFWLMRSSAPFSARRAWCCGKVRLLIFLSSIALICTFEGCQTPPDRVSIEKEGKLYGVTEGSFRHRWWNYYERALSFADGGFWQEAISDLNQALGQRDGDQRRARTYGFHFVDYFPHRELGVVFYNQGRLEDAIKELMISLAAVKSSKAELYLDRARKALIEKSRLDQLPPEITINSPAQLFLTNAFSTVIQGMASDDTYVRNIRVGKEEVPVDVSSQRIPFSIEVPLVPGQNSIPVSVTDLVGKTTTVLVSIQVDRTGPVVRIDEPAEGALIRDTGVILKGYAFDDSGLSELVVNGQKFQCDGSQELRIEQPVLLQPSDRDLEVEVKDRAGNITSARIDLRKTTEAPPREVPPPDRQDRTPPLLRMRNIEKEQTTYLAQAFIEGNVRDGEGVKHLFVNDEQILNKSGKNIYFSRLIKLNEGDNMVTIRGVDLSGNNNQVTIKIRRLAIKVHEVGARLRVAVGLFDRKTIGIDQQLSFGFEDLVTSAMLDRARFSAIERRQLMSLLEELKLSQTKLVDEDTALKLGKILAADCMLFGSVLERVNSVETYARLVDTETSQVMAAVDVYGEDVDIGVLRTLSTGVDLKLTQELPVVEGIVVESEGNRIIVDLGKEKHVKNGMKLTVYQIGDSVLNPQNGIVIGQKFRELGHARIQSVMEKMSYADIEGEAGAESIRPRHCVITR